MLFTNVFPKKKQRLVATEFLLKNIQTTKVMLISNNYATVTTSYIVIYSVSSIIVLLGSPGDRAPGATINERMIMTINV